MRKKQWGGEGLENQRQQKGSTPNHNLSATIGQKGVGGRPYFLWTCFGITCCGGNFGQGTGGGVQGARLHTRESFQTEKIDSGDFPPGGTRNKKKEGDRERELPDSVLENQVIK